MKLDKEITLLPPPQTGPNGETVNPPPYTTDELKVLYISHPSQKEYYIIVEPCPTNIILFKDENFREDITIKDAQEKFREVASKEGIETFLQKTFPPTLENDPYGPGSILAGMFSALGIKATPNCSCKKRALEMNIRGIEWCEENLETICGWLREESQNRGIPYIDAVAKMVVKRAISKSKKYRDQKNEA
jgi:hypothetical protein